MPEPSAAPPANHPADDPRRAVIGDLRAEGEELDALVTGLPAADWARPTPAAGWTLAHQIAHLAWTDRAALTALTDPEGFAGLVAEAMAAPERFVDDAAEAGAARPPAELLADWRAGRAALDRALTAASPDTRFPWYGPPMKAATLASARLMETWAHGQDVADTLGVVRPPTERLRHVVRIGFATRDFAHQVRGLPVPDALFHVKLRAPGGGLWEYGPADAEQRVTGTALDFCLLVTRRAHRADLDLKAEGAETDRWLDIAQSFAGPPGADPEPRARDAR
ncbi:TIGR03084 family metal-binding protein [Streptomyces sp. BI20]|uniref:TIGR03084 family metal-binding protein n=1 Tax=Streptomyces sp. BI20 TaxID=3403460 RepID=UPI003C74F3F6